MTNLEKQELRGYCKQGYDFKRIRKLVDCSDSTIRQYLKVFGTQRAIVKGGEK